MEKPSTKEKHVQWILNFNKIILLFFLRVFVKSVLTSEVIRQALEFTCNLLSAKILHWGVP